MSPLGFLENSVIASTTVRFVATTFHFLLFDFEMFIENALRRHIFSKLLPLTWKTNTNRTLASLDALKSILGSRAS